MDERGLTTKSSEMGAYRVYALDVDGMVVRARLLEAKADDEAASVALKFGFARWQLWNGMRMIAESSQGDLTPQPSTACCEAG